MNQASGKILDIPAVPVELVELVSFRIRDDDQAITADRYVGFHPYRHATVGSRIPTRHPNLFLE